MSSIVYLFPLCTIEVDIFNKSAIINQTLVACMHYGLKLGANKKSS